MKHDSFTEPGWLPRSRDNHLESLHIWVQHAERYKAMGRPADGALWEALHEAEAVVEHLRQEYEEARR